MQPATQPHPEVPAVVFSLRPRLRCPSCGEDVAAGERTGEYRGTTMHQGCALELRCADLMTEVAAVRQIAENAMANALFAQ